MKNKKLLGLFVITASLLSAGLFNNAEPVNAATCKLMGSFNDWQGVQFVNGEVKVELAAGDYEFKIMEDSTWLGCTATITNECNNYTFYSYNGDNCKLKVTEAGVFVFTYNESTDKLSICPNYVTLKNKINDYYNSGEYIRETNINLNSTALNECSEYFHNNVTKLDRITHFKGGELWMSNEAGTYSYYGTNGNDLTGGRVSKVGDTVATIAQKNTGGMEGKYTTLFDIKNVTYEQKWTESAYGIWETTNSTVVKQFLDFTAPCFLNFNDDNSNYLSTYKATIEFGHRTMVLKLHTNGKQDSGKYTYGGSILSSAIITKKASSGKSSNWQLVGSFDGWNGTALSLDDNISYKVMDLAKGTHEFKVRNGNSWNGTDKGNGGTITECTTTSARNGWTFDSSTNCKFVSENGGKYLFELTTGYAVSIIKLA